MKTIWITTITVCYGDKGNQIKTKLDIGSSIPKIRLKIENQIVYQLYF